MSTQFNEEQRFGSASRADAASLARAELFGRDGLHVGFWGSRPLRVDGDAPLMTVAGAGSGKTRDQLAYIMCSSPGIPMIVLNPRGEHDAVSMVNHARHGEFAYSWNPVRLPGSTHHRCNPLDIHKLESPTFHTDTKFFAEGLIPLSGSANGQYFEQRGRDWTDDITKARVEQNGFTSFPDLYRTVNTVESDPPAWADVAEFMLNSRFDSVRRTAGEMLTKQREAPKEFGAIMGTIHAHLSFMSDPVLQDALEASDFSLEAVCDPEQVCKIFLNVPAEYLGIWAPLIRTFFTVAMLYKSRHPQRRRVLMVVDEAGQLGRFEALLRAFTYGRGAGIRTWAIFQDVGQIVRHYGRPALQSFLGSAQTRQFFGVRDYETARLVSDMLGTETLEYDDPWRQGDARHRKQAAALNLVMGDDPFSAGAEYAHYARASENRDKQARPLMTPDEVLAMPEDRQILFISGKNLKPVYAWKYPYFERHEMAGRYLPNPWHPPSDRVRIKTRFGSKWVRVVTEAVPSSHAHYPQYQDGTYSYVEGFKPF
ncbi:MAG: type IV secretory system conjugative DNA transfer family protein [Pseudomonadota bacterium]